MFAYVKWNRSGKVFRVVMFRLSPTLVGVPQWPLPERKPPTAEAERLGRSRARASDVHEDMQSGAGHVPSA